MNKATVDSVMELAKSYGNALGCSATDTRELKGVLRAEVERLAARAGKQGVTNLTQERALARRHGFLGAMSSGTARELCTLLRSGVKQLEAWHAKYGEHQPDWLPPAGDVRWMEDVASALYGRAVAQPPAQEPAPAPVGEYPAKALEGVEPVACLVETEQGVMVWPIADLGEASTYCDEGEFPELLYSATVSALQARIATQAEHQAKALEGVEPIGYIAWRDGKPAWSEDCVCEDAVFPRDIEDDCTSMAIYPATTVSALQARIAELEQDAARGQVKCHKGAVVREFENEIGNRIKITIEGPTSTSENILTPMEATELRRALIAAAPKETP